MANIPKGPTGKPARINLATRMSLQPLTGSQTRNDVVQYDAGEIPLALDNAQAISARALAASSMQLYVDSARGVARPEAQVLAAQPLSKEGLEAAMHSHLQQSLATTVTEILRINADALNENVPLVAAGLSSVFATQLVGTIKANLGVDIQFSAVMSADCTVVSLATDLVEQLLHPKAVLAPLPRPGVALPGTGGRLDDESFPLLPMQMIYAVGRKFDMPANICWEIELSGFDRLRFETAMTLLIERHGMLRAYIFDDGERQRIMSPGDVLGTDGWKLDQLHEPATLEEFESARQHLSARTQHFGIPLNATTFFDIQVVSRKHLDMLPADKRDTVIVSFVFDLIVADAQSLNILTSELSALYRGEDLPKLDPRAYRAFVVSKLQTKDAAAVQREAAYWEPRVSAVVEEGGLPVCPQLPQARPGAEGSHHTLRHSSSLPPEMWQRLRAWCGRECVQPNSLLFTVYSEILAAWSSTRHFIMNMAFFNRGAPSRVFGNCASTMVSHMFPQNRCLQLDAQSFASLT